MVGSEYSCLHDRHGKALTAYRFYIVYVVWLAIETTIIYFLYPETKGKPFAVSSQRRTAKLTSGVGPTLEELSRLFEDDLVMEKGQMELEGGEQGKVAAVHVEETK